MASTSLTSRDHIVPPASAYDAISTFLLETASYSEYRRLAFVAIAIVLTQTRRPQLIDTFYCAPQTGPYQRTLFLLKMSTEGLHDMILEMLEGYQHGDGLLQGVHPLQRQIIANHAGLMDGAAFYAMRVSGTLAWAMMRNSAPTTVGCTENACLGAASALIAAIDDRIEELFQEEDEEVHG